MRLSGDFETFSTGSLSRIGAYKYARLPSTIILCFAYAIDEADPIVWCPLKDPPPAELIEAARNPKLEFRAWNAAFEFNIWNVCGVEQHGLPPLPIDVFHCTMAQALVWGVPARLEQAATVLRTNVDKDRPGAALMHKMMKPRSHKDGRFTCWHEDRPELLDRLGEYCAQDVRAERSILKAIRPMPAAERRTWLLDQRMNHRGIRVDIGAIDAMQDVVDSELKRLGGLMSGLTDGWITSLTQTARLTQYLKEQDVQIDGLNKNVMPLLMRDDLLPRHREILELYREGAKSSTAKLRSMISYVDFDDERIRGLVQYGGAMRTLRWAGRGPQIQNYPRPSKEIDARIALYDITENEADASTIECFHGQPMTVISQCLRGAYIAADGHALAVCDYSGIEARVVAWLAGQDDALDVFRRDLDIYMKTARDVGSNNRQLGKILTLACGFGMGHRRFRESAANPPFNIELTKEEAIKAVYGWRDANAQIRHLWHNVDEIVRMVINGAISDRWIWTDSKKVCFRMASDARLAGAMLMKLPSGRVIVYRDAKVEEIINDPDGAADIEWVIRYDGLDWTKKWVRIRSWGGKFVENMTQAVARDLLRDALLALDNADDLLTTVHDEIIAEPLQSRADARLAEMKAVMGEAPDWAYGLPLKAEGGVMARYGK